MKGIQKEVWKEGKVRERGRRVRGRSEERKKERGISATGEERRTLSYRNGIWPTSLP